MKIPEATKTCSHCNNRLPLSAFYQIRAKDELRPRWEKICKSCKQNRRNPTQETTKSGYKRPERCIEPKSKTLVADNPWESGIRFSQASTTDFKVWEDAYGKVLSPEERVEIETNLMAFIITLAEERYRQTGEYVETM